MYVAKGQCSLTPPPTTGSSSGMSGLGCGGGSSCGCGCRSKGMGMYLPVNNPVPMSALVNTNCGLGLYLPVNNPVPTSSLVETNQGLGLFDSWDISTWGFGEWGIIAVGLYVLFSFTGDVKRGRRKVKSYRSKRAKKRLAKAEAAAL